MKEFGVAGEEDNIDYTCKLLSYYELIIIEFVMATLNKN